MEDPNSGAAPAVQDPAAPANGAPGEQPNPNNQPGDPAAPSGGQTPPEAPPANPAPKEGDEEPPVRKSKLDYILERKNKKIEKLQKSQPANPPNPENPDPNTPGGDEYSPEELTKFKKMSEAIFGDRFKAVDSLTEKTEHDDVENQVSDFFKADPHADLLKEFEGKIRKYAQHPSRSQVPIDELVWGIAGKKLITLAADAVRKAQKAALDSQAGGGGNRKLDAGAKQDWWKLPDEQFLEAQQKIMHPQG